MTSYCYIEEKFNKLPYFDTELIRDKFNVEVFYMEEIEEMATNSELREFFDRNPDVIGIFLTVDNRPLSVITDTSENGWRLEWNVSDHPIVDATGYRKLINDSISITGDTMLNIMRSSYREIDFFAIKEFVNDVKSDIVITAESEKCETATYLNKLLSITETEKK